jgi:putative DNA primase/helicase
MTDDPGGCVVCEYAQSRRSQVIVSPAAGDGATREAFPRTDAGNAELFARLYGDRLRFDHRRKRWLTWQGQWWTPDSDAEVVRLAIEAARRRYEQGASIDDLKEREAEARWSIAGESRMRIEAMLSLAKAAKPIADAGERWDADSWVLGVDNGVVDLKAGRLRMGRPDDRMTMHAAGSFYSDAECPRWEAFLQEVFGGDEELIDFIWRAVGYSLTGDTSEHCVFICHGAGANGKTTFLSTLRGVLGAYGHNMPFTTIEMQGRSSVPTDVADLAGRRFVIATETDERTRLNEARLKALSGGDPISARHLYSSYFEFKPVAKFWLAVNHKPRVEDDSYGFWRRVRLVPFLQTFKGGSADKRLDQKLRAEADGILAWAVRGCQEWQKRGLEAPDVVQMATDQYQQESDPLAAFLADQCVVTAAAVASASALYKAYRGWAEEQGLRPWEVLSSTRFGRRMGERFEKRHRDNGNVYEGVGLRAEGFEPILKGLQSDEGAKRNTTPIPSPLAKELGKPSDHPEPSGDDGRRLYALSLWQGHGSPSSVELEGHRRIVDPEKFVTTASDETLKAFISALEAMDRGA